MKAFLERYGLYLGSVAALGILAGLVLAFGETKLTRKTYATVAEVQVVHRAVFAGKTELRGIERVLPDVPLRTGPEGRARLRWDDGSELVLDRNTTLAPKATRLALSGGRVFARLSEKSSLALGVGGQWLKGRKASLAFDLRGAQKRVYCADGEVQLKGAKPETLHAGESAILQGSAWKIVPEQAFEDWTGGLATPWSATGVDHGAIGELWSTMNASPRAKGGPLAARSHRVNVMVRSEMAHTRLATTYFNAGSGSAVGDFRIALPPGALPKAFRIRYQGKVRRGRIGLQSGTSSHTSPGLYWAGKHWLRGSTGPIAPGKTLTVELEYVELLAWRNGHMRYRYPMVSAYGGIPIGEFSASVNLAQLKPSAIYAPAGAHISGAVVHMRKADVRPNADLVVEFDVPKGTWGSARAYVAGSTTGEKGGAYVMLRTEAPARATASGVTMVLLLDASRSMSPAQLDAERALVTALLEGLGKGDKVAVLAGNQRAKLLTPKGLMPVTAELRKRVAQALANLRPEGGTNLGVLMEKAADLLPEKASNGLLVYVGDGFGSLGDTKPEALRQRLARRKGGMPRLGAVLVGSGTNRLAMTHLVGNQGPLFEMADRESAAKLAVDLLADALRPAVQDFGVEFGPLVERIYPRGSRAVLAGDTVTVVGRIRKKLPRQVAVHYWKDGKRVTEQRALSQPLNPYPSDVRRRWAVGRIAELALANGGKQAVVKAALEAKLVTPWTGFTFGHGPQPGYAAPEPEVRVLENASANSAIFAAMLSGNHRQPGTLAHPVFMNYGAESGEETDSQRFLRAVELSAARVLREAARSVRACRDARAAVRPDLSGRVRLSLEITPDGKAEKVVVQLADSARSDEPLVACVTQLVGQLKFFPSGLKKNLPISHVWALPPPRKLKKARCSVASRLSRSLRRGIWHDRLSQYPALRTYLDARASCELKVWADKRTLDDLIISRVQGPLDRVAIAMALEAAGQLDAADYLRQEAIRLARTPQELWQLRLAIMGEERRALGRFRKAYSKAKADKERLKIVNRFLRLAPHDSPLLRLKLRLLSSMKRFDELRAFGEELRQDPFADAGLLADAAEGLFQAGQKEAAELAFGELIERAPRDPYARAYVGDRLRNLGLHSAATTAYSTLGELLPHAPSATLRLALAFHGTGRLDVASRMLKSLALNGGALGDGLLANLAAVRRALYLARARDKHAKNKDTHYLLTKGLRGLKLPETPAFVLLETPRLDKPLNVRLVRGKAKEQVMLAPEWQAPSLGHYLARLERGEQVARLRVRHAALPKPFPKLGLKVSLLIRGEKGWADSVLKEKTIPWEKLDEELWLDASTSKAAIGHELRKPKATKIP